MLTQLYDKRSELEMKFEEEVTEFMYKLKRGINRFKRLDYSGIASGQM